MDSGPRSEPPLRTGAPPEPLPQSSGCGRGCNRPRLEDGVSPEQKAEAREHVRRRLDTNSRVHVRINPPGSDWYDDDVAMLRGRSCTVVLPKAECDDQIRAVVDDLGGSTIMPLVETATGILSAAEVCATPGVVRAAFGSVDLAAQLGIDRRDRQALLHTRSSLVIASAAARIAAPVDSPSLDIAGGDAIRLDAEHASRLGFTGKLCVHPRQLPAVHAAFTPAEETLRWAREVVAATNGYVTVLHGQMIDKPVVDRALRLLARAPSRREPLDAP